MNGCNAHVAMGCNRVAEEKVDIFSPRTPINTEPLTSKYSIQGELGRGKFAVVKRCVNLETNEEVAAKFIRKRRRGKNCRDQILREIVMLELSRPHHRVVDLIEVFESPTEMILITEYCSGGELFHECVIEESFKESDVVRLLGEILEGVLFLHRKNILHLDLKPQNILLTKPFPEGNIKICDLGLACLVNDGEDIREIVGTPDYVAPEVLSYEPLGLSTDMWSLGVLTYVMLSACSPFDGESKQETYLNISQVNLDFPDYLFESISYGAIDFMKNLLIKDHAGWMLRSV
ncbi:serine/threonine-protein kinase 17A-like [Octopus vulgaris]|uniref:non-specific serine/threonine protein kinase n=1 Tax=Octopus vulgaris TaxID=6645 RepID=A0AA36AIE3_OCTVU|nr:serine/threonine-protein kinase 17A-like [Octopus vulgaris]